MAKVRYESLDHEFFCVKHRSHSERVSICRECFQDLFSERNREIRECADIADDLMGKYAGISDRASQFEFEAVQTVRNKILSLLQEPEKKEVK